MKKLLFLLILSVLISCTSKKDRSFAAYKEAKVLFESKNLAGSLAKLNEAIEISPDYVEAYATRAVIKAQMKDFKNALLDINKAIEFNSKRSEYFYNRGLINTSLLDYKSAVLDFERASEINPKDFAAWNNLGKTKFSLGDFNGAIQAFDRGIRLDPKFSKIYFNKANAQIRIDLNDSACFNWKKAQEMGYKEAEDSISKYCKK